MELTDPSGDELGVLRTEVDDQDRGAGGGLRLTQGMHRRGPASPPAALVRALAAVILIAAVALLLLPEASTVSASTDTTQPPTTQPPLIDNDFLPEDANLSDCVGFVERPGCGSEARGGLQMTLIFLALATGLGIIFWRITVGVKKNRANQAADGRPTTPKPASEQETEQP